MEQSVPKRRHIKFRSQKITQKQEYNIHNTAKICNQELFCMFPTFTKALHCYNEGKLIKRSKSQWFPRGGIRF